MDGPADPLALGQRIVAVLETGARTATYKLATLSALVDHCVEHLPADPGAAVDVPVHDLALHALPALDLVDRALSRTGPRRSSYLSLDAAPGWLLG